MTTRRMHCAIRIAGTWRCLSTSELAWSGDVLCWARLPTQEKQFALERSFWFWTKNCQWNEIILTFEIFDKLSAKTKSYMGILKRNLGRTRIPGMISSSICNQTNIRQNLCSNNSARVSIWDEFLGNSLCYAMAWRNHLRNFWKNFRNVAMNNPSKNS